MENENDSIVHIADAAEAQAIKMGDVTPSCISLFDDATLGGFSKGDLILVSAQTGHGKTSWCQSLTYNFTKTLGKQVLWFTYEVMASELWRKFQTMGLNREDMIYCPLKHSSGDLGWIEAKIKESKTIFPNLTIVIIDHLGFLTPRPDNGKMQNNFSSNLSAYLGMIARGIKSIALQEAVTIILPVHMRKTDTPRINDIRDSSGIAQEADLVFLLDRIAEDSSNDSEIFTNHARVTLAKNRKTGRTVKGYFEMANERFFYDPLFVPPKNNTKQSKKGL